MDDPIPATRYLDKLEYRELEHTLALLYDVVFDQDEETEFVEDMCQRVLKHGERVIVTLRQARELERLKDTYLQ